MYVNKLRQAQLDNPRHAHMIERVIDYVRYPEVSCEVVDEIDVSGYYFRGSEEKMVLTDESRRMYDASGLRYEFQMTDIET